MMEVHPVTLQGRHVRLEPLAEAHAPDLFAIGQAPEVFTYMLYGPFTSEAEVCEWIKDAHAKLAAGVEAPFAIVYLPTGRVAGSTRYMYIDRRNHVLEIGSTWHGRDYWRTPVNTECKYLLLRHAFEVCGALRVQLKTDARNTRSQTAIARLGAVREGVLRKQMIAKNGYHRDSVMFSIVDTEWPAVKANLEQKLAADRRPQTADR